MIFFNYDVKNRTIDIGYIVKWIIKIDKVNFSVQEK